MHDGSVFSFRFEFQPPLWFTIAGCASLFTLDGLPLYYPAHAVGTRGFRPLAHYTPSYHACSQDCRLVVKHPFIRPFLLSPARDYPDQPFSSPNLPPDLPLYGWTHFVSCRRDAFLFLRRPWKGSCRFLRLPIIPPNVCGQSYAYAFAVFWSRVVNNSTPSLDPPILPESR